MRLVAIYVKGRLPDGNAPAAAVIGARECSEYGKKAARYFARGLAAAGRGDRQRYGRGAWTESPDPPRWRSVE